MVTHIGWIVEQDRQLDAAVPKLQEIGSAAVTSNRLLCVNELAAHLILPQNCISPQTALSVMSFHPLTSAASPDI